MGKYWFRNYTPSTPKAVQGGIKAQNKRGAFAGNWWGKQWITTLESFSIGARLTRGKSYARSGQVTQLTITPKGVAARVQGSKVRPYKVSIALTPYSKEQLEALAHKLTTKPIYIAQLLSGEMPENLERILKSAGIPLFPGKYNDLITSCSCPDYWNPCKHVAAVFYIIAEAFDQDPFLLFTLRGINKEKFLKSIGHRHIMEGKEGEAPLPAEPLPSEHGAYWGNIAIPHHTFASAPPKVHAIMAKRLGAIPFWRSSRNFVKSMEMIYTEASLFAERARNAEEAEQERTIAEPVA